jgi:hypothetical protein
MKVSGGRLKEGRALALEILANGCPYNVLTMKQFRDVYQPDSACYQSLSLVPRTITHIFDLVESETPIYVRIHEYPTFPIVEALGLRATLAEDQDGGIVYNVKPLRPFLMRKAWRQGLSERLFSRAGSRNWDRGAGAFAQRYFDGPEDRELTVSTKMAQAVDRGEPRRLRMLVEEWSDPDRRMTVKTARETIAAVDPQAIIETILSREWESWGGSARWVRRRTDLGTSMAKDAARGICERARRENELELLKSQLDNGELFAAHARAAALRRFNLLTDVHKTLVILESEKGSLHDVAGDVLKAAQSLDHLTDSTDPLVAIDTADLKLIFRPQIPTLDTREHSDPNLGWQLAQFLRHAYDDLRGSLLTLLSKKGQKPDFCVDRRSVGAEADLVFPLEQCVEEIWYRGQ